jgi:hypothetical protein
MPLKETKRRQSFPHPEIIERVSCNPFQQEAILTEEAQLESSSYYASIGSFFQPDGDLNLPFCYSNEVFQNQESSLSISGHLQSPFYDVPIERESMPVLQISCRKPTPKYI